MGDFRWRRVATAVAIGTLVSLAGPARPAAAAGYVPLSGAGSTLAHNAIHAWTGAVAQFGMSVNYLAVGSTVGRANFTQGTVDWAASDIPYGVTDGVSNDPPPARGFAYMPDVATGTTFMYNLTIGGQRVTDLRLSGATIAKIFTGAVTTWNDPAIVADNPGLALPPVSITPVVRSDGAGPTSSSPAGWRPRRASTGRHTAPGSAGTRVPRRRRTPRSPGWCRSRTIPG